MTDASKSGALRSLNRSSLEAHTWLGLALSAAMYLVCLSGALAVFNQEFERWEQPAVAEINQLPPSIANTALANFVDRYGSESEHWHLVFPSSGIPRLVIENDDVAHFVDQDGSLGAIESSPWTSMLIDLHYYLHLPSSVGMIVVSACGVMLLALIVSGVCAHRRIFRDAFRFRRGGRGTQETIDLHNRLSVWGLPFHLMISFTGAYYGLAGILIFVSAQAFFDGDIEAVTAPVFAPEPTGISVPDTGIPDITAAIVDLAQRDPDGTPIFLTVHEPNTTNTFVEVYVQQPERLIYAESYRYDTNGNYIGSGEYREGATGKQVIYSMYRMHFGDFAGTGTKLLYFILGLMLAVISASGVSIWLAKRSTTSIFDRLWPAFVWGVPVAMAITALLASRVTISLTAVFWFALLVLIVLATRWPTKHIAVRLRWCVAGLIVLILLDYARSHGEALASPAAWPVNVALLLTAMLMVLRWPTKHGTANRRR